MSLETEVHSAVVQSLIDSGWPEDDASGIVKLFDEAITALKGAAADATDTVTVPIGVFAAATFAFGQSLGVDIKLSPADA